MCEKANVTQPNAVQENTSETIAARRYVVAERLKRWCVSYEDAPIGKFHDVTAATKFACDVASLEAQTGVTTIVMVQTAVLETHCFSPPAAASPERPPTARL